MRVMSGAVSGARVTPTAGNLPQLPVVAQDVHLPVEVSDWLASLTDELLAPATRRAYRSAVRAWAEYASSVGVSAMPPDEGALLAHTKALADGGASLSRIRLLAAALAKAGAYAGHAKCVPPSVRLAISTLAAQRGRDGTEPKQAVGVRADALLSVAMASKRPRPRGRGSSPMRSPNAGLRWTSRSCSPCVMGCCASRSARRCAGRIYRSTPINPPRPSFGARRRGRP